MKAAVLHAVNDIRVDQVDDLRPADDGVLIRIKACGVCATDVNMWRGTNTEGTFPFIPGHEWVGEVVEAGRRAGRWRPGDRVVGEVTVACGTCANCREGLPPEGCMDSQLYGFRPQTPGGMAQFHASPEGRLHRVPDELTDDEATLVEPLSIAYHAVWAAGGGIKPHDRVAVFGCGPIGMLTMLVCKAAGVFVMAVEPHPVRRQMALDFGADVALDPTAGDLADQVLTHTEGRGASLAVECSGNNGARAATVDVVARRGRIALVGIRANSLVPLEFDKIVFNGITITGSDGSGFYFAKPLDFMARHLVNVQQVITHHFELDKIGDALKLGSMGADSCKITIVP